MSTSSCILIPVYPRHYPYLVDVLQMNNAPFPIYVCFTNREEFDLFDKKELFIAPKYNFFFLEDLIDLRRYRKRFNEVGSWINVKKFVGLKHLHDTTQFDHFLVIDAEVKFLTSPELCCDYEAFVKQSVDSRVIIGTCINGKHEVIQTINNTSMDLLPSEWRTKLEELTCNKEYLAWWSTIPIYERKYLDDFYEVLGPDYFTKLVYRSFDYVIYYLFLIFKGYVTLKTVPWGLECSPRLEHFLEISAENIILWVSRRIYDKDPEYFKSRPEVMIIFHLDRA